MNLFEANWSPQPPAGNLRLKKGLGIVESPGWTLLKAFDTSEKMS